MRGYRRWFGVDLLCAIVELRALGIRIPSEYEAAMRKTIVEQSKRRRKREHCKPACHPDGDENFAYIAGYTAGGAPYGTTWEQFEQNDAVATALDEGVTNAGDIPF